MTKPRPRCSKTQAQEQQAILRQDEADDQATESQARLGQAIHTIDTVDTLMSQRPAKAAKVDSARLDLERTRVVAPFDAYVTNMNIAEGAYARPGAPLFTLIDTRTWYVIANYRESKLKDIRLGDHVDVYLMGHPERKFDGEVESIGFGVFPEDGKVSDGLPNIDRTLNWVHLSSRFPVRVRVQQPRPGTLPHRGNRANGRAMNTIAANSAAASQHSASRQSWWHRFWQDQQPTPGRLNSSLRIVLASMLALILMLALQMPFISIGMYFIFLIATR